MTTTPQGSLFNKPTKKAYNQDGHTEMDLANKIVDFLERNGYKAWHQPNTGIFDFQKGYFRKPKKNLKGVPDVIGFHLKSGRFVGVEIKINDDVLSNEQKGFIYLINQSGGMAFIAKTFDQFKQSYKERVIV